MISRGIFAFGFLVLLGSFVFKGQTLIPAEVEKQEASFSSVLGDNAKTLKVYINREDYLRSAVSADQKEYFISICNKEVCDQETAFDKDQLFEVHMMYLKAKKHLSESFSLRGQFYHWLEGRDQLEITKEERALVSTVEILSVFFTEDMRPSRSDLDLMLKRAEIPTFHESLNKSSHFRYEVMDVYSLDDEGESLLNTVNVKTEDKRFLSKFNSYKDYLVFYLKVFNKILERTRSEN